MNNTKSRKLKCPDALEILMFLHDLRAYFSESSIQAEKTDCFYVARHYQKWVKRVDNVIEDNFVVKSTTKTRK